jgi:SAM-dependent MidA family methyltransferase
MGHASSGALRPLRLTSRFTYGDEVDWPTWREATERALYGPDGFYRRERSGDHFRTSTHASPLFADAIVTLARLSEARTVLDLGAGGGELMRDVRRQAPDLDLIGVDLAARPRDLSESVAWASTVTDLATGFDRHLADVLVVANEWLDNVPVDVVEMEDAGQPRLVHVDPATGIEQLGEAPGSDDAQWLARWWPLDDAAGGERAEIGRTRDDAWADVVRRVHRGVLVAIDYGHRRGNRPLHGTLAGYRAGRLVAAVPDGSCDITAHVALDACASAGAHVGATTTVLTTQRMALRALGVDGTPPDISLASSDPAAYLTALSHASEGAELLDPAGLGGFSWLIQAVGRPLPDVLAELSADDGSSVLS